MVQRVRGVNSDLISSFKLFDKKLDQKFRSSLFQRLVSSLLIFACTLSLTSVSEGQTVFLSPEILQRARERIGKYTWASSVYKGIKSNADSWMRQKLPVPMGPTGWYHHYFCPEHGVRLKYDYNRPHEHICPEDGKVWTGDEYDAYWRTVTHGSIVGKAVDLALVYALYGHEEYARAAGEILLDYADFYPEHIRDKEKKRIMWQSLDEATFILKPAQAYELIRDAGVLSEDEKRHIEEDWLRPTALFLRGERKTIHNIHCWYNAAICSLGLLLDDQELVDFAVEGPEAGFRQQIEKGVQEDGFWYEGSFGYHFYTIMAMQNLIISALNNGIDLAEELQVVKRMFLAPMLMADAQFVVPPTNDSGLGNLMNYVSLYEIATHLFPRENSFPDFLAYTYENTGRHRAMREALFYGRDELPRGERVEAGSANFTGVGLAVLRKLAGGSEKYVMFDYGPHGGGHGHPDKMNIIISGMGQVLAPDTGTAGYGLAVNKSWYRQTLSHNTIVVDRESQKPTQGELLGFHADGGDVQWVSAKAGEAYPDVNWQRTVFLADEGYIVVIDTLESPMEHIYDWVYHNYGELEVLTSDMRPCDRGEFGETIAYMVPNDLRSAASDHDIQAVWKLDGVKWVQLSVMGQPGTEIYTGIGPGNPAKIDVPMMVIRRRGKDARFFAVVEPVDGAANVKALWQEEEGIAVESTDGNIRHFFSNGSHKL